MANTILEPAIIELAKKGYKFTLLLAIADRDDPNKAIIGTQLYDMMPYTYRESVRKFLAYTRKRLLYRPPLPGE